MKNQIEIQNLKKIPLPNTAITGLTGQRERISDLEDKTRGNI